MKTSVAQENGMNTEVRTISRETIRKRVETLSRDGRLSAATRSIEELSCMIEDDVDVKEIRKITLDEARRAISDLHPKATEDDAFDVPDELGEYLKITDDNILDAVKRLPTGYTGWTYAAIHAIVLPRNNNNEMLSVVKIFFNYLLSGRLINRRLTDSRAV
jgi:hypothetical protein